MNATDTNQGGNMANRIEQLKAELKSVQALQFNAMQIGPRCRGAKRQQMADQMGRLEERFDAICRELKQLGQGGLWYEA